MELGKIPKQIRFLAVGVVNTLVDFGLYVFLVSLSGQAILANYVSTTVALIFSFFANKYFTFEDKGSSRGGQFVKFLGITLIGLWLIQPIIIFIVIEFMGELSGSDNFIYVLAKVVATIFTLVWNYLLYNRVVFKR